MVRTIVFLCIKIILIFGLISGSYYFFVLKPHIDFNNEKSKQIALLVAHKDNLVESRLAYVQLAKLDPKSVMFGEDQNNVVTKIKDSNKKGMEMSDKFTPITYYKLRDLNQQITDLFNQTKETYKTQNSLMEKVLSAKTYNDAVNILKSDDSVNLLLKQRNLITGYTNLISTIQKTN